MSEKTTTETTPTQAIKYTRGMQQFRDGKWLPNRIFWRRVNGKDCFLTAYLSHELSIIEAEQRKLESRKERFKKAVKEFRKISQENNSCHEESFVFDSPEA